MFMVSKSCIRWFVLSPLAALLVGFTAVHAEPVSWMERYALAKDREAMLAELIPGSDDYFFYHCLFYQTNGKLERSEAMLAEWRDSKNGKETAAIVAMTDRQRLLTYEASPKRSIDYLVRRLGIDLNHAPPTTRAERRFPSELDSAKLAEDVLLKDALKRRDVIKVAGLRSLGKRFLQDRTAGFNISLRDFLGRVKGAYIDQLGELVVREIKSRPANKQVFGDLNAHQFLTRKELEVLGREVPKVAADEKFVSAMLQRLRPTADQDLVQQLDVKTDYLERVEAYVRRLPGSYAGMQAAAMYRLLEVNLQNGVYDRELFERYLKLPRLSPLVHEDLVRNVGLKARLSDDFTDRALLPPVGNEEPVVRMHLQHFLKNENDSDEFKKYLKPEYLRRVFAETKLLNGIGNDEQWYKMLDAKQRKELRDRVELQLSIENPRYFSDDEKTQLKVDIKNIPELVVRTYKINTSSYYRHHSELLNTDIDLDGLVATQEQKIRFNHPAVIRHGETIDLPGVADRGVWVVDLFGKGLRARALIRRGLIGHVQSTDANGMVFTIIDEHGEPIPAATMWVSSREFIADDKGRIVLPPVVDQGIRKAVISDGFIARPVQFSALLENYELTAGFHLDRSCLQGGGETDLVIRPRLMLGNQPIAPETLQDVVVQISARDLDGIVMKHEMGDLEIKQNEDLVVPLRVPLRLSNLEVTLRGSLVKLANGQQQTLTVSKSWDVSGIRQTNLTHDAFLTRDDKDYLIEVRGRNGEPIAGASVSVAFTTNVRNSAVNDTFQSDDQGKIRLGELSGVDVISFSVSGGLRHQRELQRDGTHWADEIHAAVGRDIVLPLPEFLEDASARFRFIELRGGAYGTDRTGRLLAGSGLLSIRKVPAGDYHLIDLETARIVKIAVVDGPVIDSVVVGKIRHGQMSLGAPLGIASIQQDAEGLKIQLSGETDLAHVHLYASRYMEGESPMRDLELPHQTLSGRRVYLPPSGYVSNLRLGDEYQYVLQRRYAKKYSGVMLPQPGVLLNPWETEETSNVSQQPEKSERMPAANQDMDRMSRLAESAKEKGREQKLGSDYDFLSDAGFVLPNLKPDENGVVFVPQELLQDFPVLQVVACTPAVIIQRTFTQKAKPAKLLDLRLAESLDTEFPLTFKRGVLIAGPDQPLDLASLGSAQLQVYGSVGQLMNLYKNLVPDPRLGEFDELAVWHTLDRSGKLRVYSRLASHELHLFLRFHDRDFFDKVVKPLLANKKEKQFIDHWLLGSDLSRYKQLWNYNQLNAAERALFAMREPQVRETVRRQLREIVATQPENHELQRLGIESALKSMDLSAFDDAMDDDLVETEEKLMLGGGMGGMGGGGFGGRPAPGNQARTRFKRSRKSADEQLDEEKSKAKLYMGRSDKRQAGSETPFFRKLDPTKQWAESQWDHVRTVGSLSPGDLIAAGPFWRDLAGMDVESLRVSDNLLRPVTSRHDALVALALSGLPLSAGDVSLPADRKRAYQPEHEVAVVTKQLQRLEVDGEAKNILLGQRFERINAVSGKQVNSDPDEFLVGVGYQGHIVVSNPTVEERTVDIFWQVPAGSLPLGKNRFTDSRTIKLEPFGVQAIYYQFYFPEAGKFTHYPATAALDSKLLARGDAREFAVVEEYTKSNEVTWQNIVAKGDPEAIREFLTEANLREIDWSLIAYRMKDAEVYKVVTGVLEAEKISEPVLWAYGFAHQDEAAIQTYLTTRQDLCMRVGPVLESSLLRVDPVERRMFELLEYSPLVRARIHRLGDDNQILNSTFRTQYEQFARMLGFSQNIDDQHKLVLAYYLLIQNRITEAIDTFDEVDSAKIETRLQYDYMAAYLAMHQGEYQKAQEIAVQYADNPIPRWKMRFSQLSTQLKQQKLLAQTQKLVGADRDSARESFEDETGDLLIMDREAQQASAAEQQPEVLLSVEGSQLRIDHRMTKQVDVNFYGVDLELLFSKAPFVRSDLQRMAMVEPAYTESLKFESVNGMGLLPLNENQQRQTLLVEAVSGASRSTALYYGGDLTTYVSESFGQLQTTDSESHRPIPATYVKVYAKYPNGQIKFYKDGYTDARGRFDYASVSASDAQGAVRFAILVLSEEKGATLHDVAAPNH